MADRKDTALTVGAEPEALDRVRTVRRDVKDLLPRQRDFHRTLELPRCYRRQDGGGVDPKLAAKPSTDERADQAYILNGNFQGCRDRPLALVEHLVGGVQ